ncbi:hypothetical protein O6H91_11G114600 [Diphasiastrum complanatum]|uniref:Uncharacterized protein n=1 Tax=Diphasiastrum complanatum TaxID=34168 RepID=A0ACC2CD01_DIPCM|nr:hypothetical protein O6H91_11G114600 [Diphasiastrum complanatum]
MESCSFYARAHLSLSITFPFSLSLLASPSLYSALLYGKQLARSLPCEFAAIDQTHSTTLSLQFSSHPAVPSSFSFVNSICNPNAEQQQRQEHGMVALQNRYLLSESVGSLSLTSSIPQSEGGALASCTMTCRLADMKTYSHLHACGVLMSKNWIKHGGGIST